MTISTLFTGLASRLDNWLLGLVDVHVALVFGPFTLVGNAAARGMHKLAKQAAPAV